MEVNLDNFPDYLYSLNQSNSEEWPAAKETYTFVEDIIDFLFPFRTKINYSIKEFKLQLVKLEIKLEGLMTSIKDKLKHDPGVTTRTFLEKLPEIHKRLMLDAEAFMKFDPAAESVEEIILSYPGFFSIAVYRLSHELRLMKVPVLPRLMSEYAHGKTGVDIHPGATIGDSFFIDHGTGTVIGETAVIGDNVKIYQGVTLGALFVQKSLAKKKRHPTIEDNVIIYARSTILGGDTRIGHDSVIGGNVWLTESVQPFSVVYQKHHVVVRDSKVISEQINWVI
ncbi:MAG: serine acetyltransferase [Bacteroidales bacterium]|nr:serine acetyltransferase [Bacteroidales bacterium]